MDQAPPDGGREHTSTSTTVPVMREILPKCGLVYSEKGNLSEVLCKPKIMPIKSAQLEKLEQMIKKMTEANTQEGDS